MKKFQFRKYSSFFSLLAIFLVWRILLVLSAFFGLSLIPLWGNRFPYFEEQLIATKLPFWIWSWGNFDGVHYLTIAKSFYSAYYTQTFFPFYPLVIRFITKIFLFDHYLVSALIISNLCFFLSLYYFNKLLLVDKYVTQIRWIILFLVLFPVSFFFGSIYTEGLFLLLVILSFYSARKNKWFISGVFGMLASATRLGGVFLFFALIVEYFVSFRNKRKPVWPFLSICLIPLGLVIYMVFLHFKFSDFLLFWHAQPAFGAERTGTSIILPIQVLFRYFRIFSTIPVSSLAFLIALFEFCSFIIAIMLLIIAHQRKVRLSYLVYSWFAVIIPSLTGTLSSMPRYVLTAFPIFIVLGSIRNRFIKISLLFFSTVILIITAILFTRGYWVS